MTEALVQLLDTWRVAAEPRRRMPCQREPRLWFSTQPSELGRAKALCRTCPVRTACLEGALERAEPHGVWGGEILQDGVVVALKRGRGRPRKQAA
jgi:WhiB family transcriptional regulator, redox-sensing transcriptional regulator